MIKSDTVFTNTPELTDEQVLALVLALVEQGFETNWDLECVDTIEYFNTDKDIFPYLGICPEGNIDFFPSSSVEDFENHEEVKVG